MSKIVMGLHELRNEYIENLTKVLNDGDYEIVESLPNENNKPVGLFDQYMNQNTYQFILNDKNAFYVVFFLRYKTFDSKIVEVPMGIFGTSPRHKINFPLFANDQLRSFLELSKSDLSDIILIDNILIDNVYNNLLRIRFELLKRIFKFYINVFNTYNSIMSWPVRKADSLTRLAAESLNLYRKESPNGKTEMYSCVELDAEKSSYIGECSSRWKKIGDMIAQPSVRSEATDEYDFKISSAAKVIYNELALNSLA